MGTDIRYFDYEEFSANRQSLNHETGLIPGIKIASNTFALGMGHTLELSIWDGTADYEGRTQSGQPHRTQTDETIYRLLYRAEWQPQYTDGSLYAKVYWQNWDRDIQPANSVSGLFERYQWWTIEAGLRATVWQQPNQNLALEVGVLQTNHGTILIDLSNDNYGKPTLDLNQGLGAALALDYAINLANNKQLQLKLSFTTWKFGRSDSKTLSNGVNTIIIAEPDSVSNQFSISITYGY